MTGYEIGSAISDVARGEKTAGEAARDASVGVAVGAVSGGAGKVLRGVTKRLDGEWLSLPDAGAAKASDIKKAASDAFREATSGSNKQAHSGQGHKKKAAQASALEDFIRKHEKDFLPEYMAPIKKEADRMRKQASADKHK